MAQTSDKKREIFIASIMSFENLNRCFQQHQKVFSSLLKALDECNLNVERLKNLENEHFTEIFERHRVNLNYFEMLEENNSLFLGLETVYQLNNVLQDLTTKIKSKISFDVDNSEKNVNPSIAKASDSDSPCPKRIKYDDILESTIEEPTVGSFNEIAGLDEIKKNLRCLMILPQNQPQLFLGRKIMNCILLYGPPGTGKTKLVHAAASEAKAILHSLSASTILSSYIGETEKTLKSLFDNLKKKNELSILFIDEIDGFCRQRAQNEHEYSRRLKTEFMRLISSVEQHDKLFVIGATNCPWELDVAILRRFHKRFYVPLPNANERYILFRLLLKNTPLEYASVEHWTPLINITEGFSGSDISNLVQNAMNSPLLELEDNFLWTRTESGSVEPVTEENINLDNSFYSNLDKLPQGSVRGRPLQMSDLIKEANSYPKSSSTDHIEMYETFNNRLKF